MASESTPNLSPHTTHEGISVAAQIQGPLLKCPMLPARIPELRALFLRISEPLHGSLATLKAEEAPAVVNSLTMTPDNLGCS